MSSITPSIRWRLPSHPASVPPPWPAWLREPLLQFVLIGGVVFGIDAALVAHRDDPHTIVVGAEVDAEARRVFKAARGRDPNAAELGALRRVWLDNEVLYREGLALQVDRGDTAIRERIVFKALSIVDAGTKLPPADDAVLQTWFAQHRDKYDEPVRYDFEEAVLSGGPASDAAVRAFVQSLDAGAPGEAQAGLRVFKGRPVGNLVQSYGPTFAQALDTLPPGVWRVLPSRDGARAIRLVAITPAKAASFDLLRNVVRQDWADATLAAQRSAAVGALAKKYRVRYDGVAP